MPIDPDRLAALVKPKPPQVVRGRLTKQQQTIAHLPPPQTSNFVRWVGGQDYLNLRCAWRGCGSPTCIRVQGIPYCEIHTIHILADLLDEAINSYPNRSQQAEEQLMIYYTEQTLLSERNYKKEIQMGMLFEFETPPTPDPEPDPEPEDEE